MTLAQKLNAALAVGGLLIAGFFLTEYENIPDEFFADPLGPRFLPMFLIVALFIVSFLILVRSFRPAAPSVAGVPAPSEDGDPTSRPVQVAILLLAGCVYVFAMPYLGYYIVSFAFALLILFMGRPEKLLRNVIAAAALTLIFYLLFGLALNVPFPKPELFQ